MQNCIFDLGEWLVNNKVKGLESEPESQKLKEPEVQWAEEAVRQRKYWKSRNERKKFQFLLCKLTFLWKEKEGYPKNV